MLKHVRQPVTIKIASVRMVARPVMRNVRSVVPPRIRNASPAARNQALRQLVRLGHIPWPYKRRAEATAACPSPTQMRAIIKSTYRATRQSEKAKLTVLQQLESGGWGQIWSQTDIQPTGWGHYVKVVSLPASDGARSFSATAEASNPQTGESEGTMQYGQYCVQLDTATNSVTAVLLYLSPHSEADWVNTVVMYSYAPPVPNNQFKGN